MREVSWRTEDFSDFQEEIRFMDLVVRIHTEYILCTSIETFLGDELTPS